MIHHRRQTKTPGTTCPTLCDKCAGSFTSNRIMNIEGLWDRTFGLSSLFEKTRESNRLQMWLQRQHFLFSYLKTLSVGPARVERTISRMTARCSTNWATGARWLEVSLICPTRRLRINKRTFTNHAIMMKWIIVIKSLKGASKNPDFYKIKRRWREGQLVKQLLQLLRWMC